MEIRDAARRAFGRRGIAGTGLTHVAAEAGMARSSLYHYYPDKRSLVRDLLRDLLREEEELFSGALQAEGTALERIERLARDLPGVFEDWGRLGSMIFDLWSRDARHFRPFFRRIRSDLARLIREGQSTGEIDRTLDSELAAATVIGAIDGLLLQHLVDPRAFPSFEDLGEVIAQVLRKGLRP